MSACGADVVGVDASPVAVEEAQRRYPEVTFLVLSGVQLDRRFAPASLDAITCIQVLEHIPPDQVDDLIAQCTAVLRAGGRLLIDVPVTDNLSDRWLVVRNQHLRGMRKPPGAIDSSFNPTHLWKIGNLDRLIGRFKAQGLQPERVRRLYYVPWLLDRLEWGRLITYLPDRWMEQLLKGSTILFRKGAVKSASQAVEFSAFWSDPNGWRGVARLKKLFA
jgi:2-polyprenyl-3-methyl-5-hydroxy-6-metoxy-1,4-benzoquinol methylase